MCACLCVRVCECVCVCVCVCMCVWYNARTVFVNAPDFTRWGAINNVLLLLLILTSIPLTPDTSVLISYSSKQTKRPHGQFLMRQVTPCHEIESEAVNNIDLGSFLMS